MKIFVFRNEGVIHIRHKGKNNEITLLIPDEIINSKVLSNYAITTYCVLQALSAPTQMPIQCVTYHQIIFYLTGKTDQQRNKIMDHIRCGLNELIKNNIIKKQYEFQKHFVLDCSNIWTNTKKENFAIILFSDVQRIFKIENINNFILLRYFIFLIGTISSKTTVYLEDGSHKNRVVGNVTIDYLSKISGVSDRTIIEYNKILENAGLLYIYRCENFILKGENIRKLPNVYGRPCDKSYIDAFAIEQKKHNESYNFIEGNNKQANKKRMLAQMYQQLLKGNGEKYTQEEITDIYNYVISENKKYERMYEKNGYEDYLNKIRDVEIFKKYEFLIEK